MDIDAIIADLHSPSRNLAKELADAMQDFEPDDNTKMASIVLAELAKHLCCGILALDLAEFRTEDGKYTSLDESGDLPEELDRSITTAAIICAIARDESKEGPREMSYDVIRCITDNDAKERLARRALDNLRKRKYHA